MIIIKLMDHYAYFSIMYYTILYIHTILYYTRYDNRPILSVINSYHSTHTHNSLTTHNHDQSAKYTCTDELLYMS